MSRDEMEELREVLQAISPTRAKLTAMAKAGRLPTLAQVQAEIERRRQIPPGAFPRP